MDHFIKPKRKSFILLWLIIFVIGMFFFGYGLVPLYNVMCKSLGLNGKYYNDTGSKGATDPTLIDKSRTIQVTFISHVHSDLPWKFYPLTKKIQIHPGEKVKIKFFAENESDQTITVQAIPSITPGYLAVNLKKTECFCFEQQTLKGHQSMEMPVIFHLDNKVPKNARDITLSYTLYKWTRPITNKTPGRLGD